MGSQRTPRAAWVTEGLRALVDGGPEAVRIEALAKALGVTKGGFYGYFADRDALLTAMLDSWEYRAVDEVLAEVERVGGNARERIQVAGRRTFPGGQLLQIDLAVRAWAHHDAAVAARLRRVDNQRMRLTREMISTFCSDPDEIEARSLLAFCLAIGHHFLAADHPGRTQEEIRAHAANIILKQ